MQFLGKLVKQYVGAPPGVGAPPVGNPGSTTAYDSNNSNCKIVVSSHHVVAIIYYMIVSILAGSLFQIIWKQ